MNEWESITIVGGNRGIRSELITCYEIPRWFYSTFAVYAPHKSLSPVRRMSEVGLLMWYALGRKCGGGKRRILMDVDVLVEKWRVTLVRMCLAHTKDEADRAEASIEELLTPILAAPIKQLREFAPRLLDALRNDPGVPFLVWHAYEVWLVGVLNKAADEDVKQLKTEIAREIADLVEQDVKSQLPEALIRALQWRSPKQLDELKAIVEQEKAAGRPVRLRGRESCLFLEAGGTEEEPLACVQI